LVRAPLIAAARNRLPFSVTIADADGEEEQQAEEEAQEEEAAAPAPLLPRLPWWGRERLLCPADTDAIRDTVADAHDDATAAAIWSPHSQPPAFGVSPV